MTDNFFVNYDFTVSQNANIYTQSISTTESTYDYVFTINVAENSWASMNDLFNTREFVQNSNVQNTSGENATDVTLQLNRDSLNDLLFATNCVDISSTKAAVATTNAAVYNTLDKGNNKLLGLRFLEVVATKVFGHAKARSAIQNDSDFYRSDAVTGSLINQIANGISDAFVNGSKRNEIFNVYVSYDRVQDNVDPNANNDANSASLFNFDSTTWEFPIHFTSTVVDAGSDTTSLSELNNGPSVGGALLTNGSMNVPILLRFIGA